MRFARYARKECHPLTRSVSNVQFNGEALRISSYSILSGRSYAYYQKLVLNIWNMELRHAAANMSVRWASGKADWHWQRQAGKMCSQVPLKLKKLPRQSRPLNLLYSRLPAFRLSLISFSVVICLYERIWIVLAVSRQSDCRQGLCASSTSIWHQIFSPWRKVARSKDNKCDFLWSDGTRARTGPTPIPFLLPQ